jgi:23S rRNA (adenine2030-N6)-methyltransferase
MEKFWVHPFDTCQSRQWRCCNLVEGESGCVMNIQRLLLVSLALLLPMSITGFISRTVNKNSAASKQLFATSSRLDYVHGYHAGNYADVVKHSVLILLLEHMKKKASPFVYVDTHAGAGSYPLDSRESSQMGEFKHGIGRLLALEKGELEDPLSTLIDMTKGDDDSSASIYPGSPMIAKTLSRSQDTHLLFEKARDQFDLLNKNMEHGEIRNEDGYKGLAYYAEGKKGLPRALVFVDPPYQYGSDTDQICQMVKHLSWHWKSARVALWYPASDDLKEKSNRLLSIMRDSSDADMLALEMYGNDAVGTGMVLVNPPYGIEEELRSKLPRIAKLLGEEKPTMRMKWL